MASELLSDTQHLKIKKYRYRNFCLTPQPHTNANNAEGIAETAESPLGEGSAAICLMYGYGIPSLMIVPGKPRLELNLKLSLLMLLCMYLYVCR